MNTRQIIRWAILFAVLGAAGISLVVLGGRALDLELRAALPLVGASLFSSALTFFLVKVVD